MIEYLYKITCGKFSVSDLSNEEIIYVMANEKLCAYR